MLKNGFFFRSKLFSAAAIACLCLSALHNGVDAPAKSPVIPIASYSPADRSVPKTDDEFVGPFKSWLNVKTGFGAKGNGVSDDTAPLQAAFNAAARGMGNSTLYLPPGTYLIKKTLTLNHYLNVSIIGADPATTILKWGGTDHGTMLQNNGTAYSKFDRITWNGSKKADIAVDQSWDGKSPHFDTGNEYADDVFVDVGFGIRGGALGYGFAETSILRDRFIRNTTAGVSLGDFNALDIWVRNSIFQDCAIGVTNTLGAGNFKLYNNIFRNSTNSDISMYNTGGFSIRGNTSTHSKQFFLAGGSSNPALIIMEGNTIIDPVNTQAVTIGNQGPVFFLNNIIRSSYGTSDGPAAQFNLGHKSNIYSSGNTFTVTNPVSVEDNKVQYNDKVVSRNSLKYLTEQKLPGVEPNLNRRIFEVPPGAGSAAIQAVINKAALASGTRPVVHFPHGNYDITNTLVIPANSDLQIAGDGFGNQFASMLVWTGSTAGPIITITGPSKATIRDITFKGSPLNTNILITDADQKGSRIFLQEFNQSGGQAGLLADHLDHTLILGHDTEFSGLKKAISVVGGDLAAAGTPAEGRTIIYSGAESNNAISHEVSNGGNLMVQDTWYEGGIKSTYANLSGKGIFTADGNKIAMQPHTDVPSVVVNNFSGKATIIAADYDDRVAISGDCSQAKILILGILAENDPFIEDRSSKKPDIRALLSRTRDYKSMVNRSGSYSIPDIGTYSQKFVNSMLSDMLSVHPVIITALPQGITDVRFYRVMSINGARGLVVQGAKSK